MPKVSTEKGRKKKLLAKKVFFFLSKSNLNLYTLSSYYVETILECMMTLKKIPLRLLTNNNKSKNCNFGNDVGWFFVLAFWNQRNELKFVQNCCICGVFLLFLMWIICFLCGPFHLLKKKEYESGCGCVGLIVFANAFSKKTERWKMEMGKFGCYQTKTRRK